MREPHIVRMPEDTAAPVRQATHVFLRDELRRRANAIRAAYETLAGTTGAVADVADCLVATLRGGGKLLVAGNGGSATEAQHFAAELVGRFKRERAPYAALALTTDTAILTALANDYGYHDVFARQVRALGGPGDALLAFSTSGESPNLLAAAAAARERGMHTIALTGARPNQLANVAELSVRVPATDVPVIQELHMGLTHLLCDLIEREMCACPPTRERPIH